MYWKCGENSSQISLCVLFVVTQRLACFAKKIQVSCKIGKKIILKYVTCLRYRKFKHNENWKLNHFTYLVRRPRASDYISVHLLQRSLHRLAWIKSNVFLPFPFSKLNICLHSLKAFMVWCGSDQGLLKLLWTVYSEGKLQSCLKLRNFQNPFNKDKSGGL